MTETDVVLDDNVAGELAWVICGDEPPLRYRTGSDIERLFQVLGWRIRNGLDGGRMAWTRQQVLERSKDSDAMRALITRLADRREYVGEPEAHKAAVAEINRLLALEDLMVTFEGSRPMVVGLDHLPENRMTSLIPAELTANLTEIVGDQMFADQLKGRLEQAHACWESGAPTAAIIMLGSLLEGVLYDYLKHHPVQGQRVHDRFELLIDLAREQRWISKDVADYAHVLRNHRNLVHPKRQLLDDYRPDPDTVRIAWNVVVAALNDLAAAANQTPS